jgi:hypothetical protein
MFSDSELDGIAMKRCICIREERGSNPSHVTSVLRCFRCRSALAITCRECIMRRHTTVIIPSQSETLLSATFRVVVKHEQTIQ